MQTLHDTMPMIHPKVRVVASVECAGIGRFPVDTSTAPVLDTQGWWKLASGVAKQDLQRLGGVLEVAAKHLSRM